jgi:hypothetical protein
MKMAKVRKQATMIRLLYGTTDQYMNALCSDQIGWEECKSPDNYNKPPNQFDDYCLKRRQKYTVIRGLYGRAVHRRCVTPWRLVVKVMFSTFIPISQEAFLPSLYKNGYNNWLWMHNNATSEYRRWYWGKKPGYLYTTAGATEGAHSLPEMGGGQQRACRSSTLCTQSEGKQNYWQSKFDTSYKKHWRETKIGFRVQTNI